MSPKYNCFRVCSCRRETFFLPWKCEHERHDYETCEYKEYTRRMHNQKVKKLMAEARE